MSVVTVSEGNSYLIKDLRQLVSEYYSHEYLELDTLKTLINQDHRIPFMSNEGYSLSYIQPFKMISIEKFKRHLKMKLRPLSVIDNMIDVKLYQYNVKDFVSLMLSRYGIKASSYYAVMDGKDFCVTAISISSCKYEEVMSPEKRFGIHNFSFSTFKYNVRMVNSGDIDYNERMEKEIKKLII